MKKKVINYKDKVDVVLIFTNIQIHGRLHSQNSSPFKSIISPFLFSLKVDT